MLPRAARKTLLPVVTPRGLSVAVFFSLFYFFFFL